MAVFKNKTKQNNNKYQFSAVYQRGPKISLEMPFRSLRYLRFIEVFSALGRVLFHLAETELIWRELQVCTSVSDGERVLMV